MDKIYNPEFRKNEVLLFIEKNGRKPNQRDPLEKKLWGAMASYCFPSACSFDPEFKQKLDELYQSRTTICGF